MKTQTKHTPGPWKAYRNKDFWTVSNDQYIILDVREHLGFLWRQIYPEKLDLKTEIDEQTTKANARLIAAAPELLEACKAILKARDNGILMINGPEHTTIRLVEQAISKAQGE